MCTAITYQTNNLYFGRNLDLHFSYDERVTVTPRCYPFHFRNGKVLENHHAMIGMATISEGYPLYYEATNEKGLSLAGLNFPTNATYYPAKDGMDNIAPFELIPWILGQCASVTEALTKIKNLNLWKEPYSQQFPLSPLHWLLADQCKSIVLEPLADGLRVVENPVGVLTNNPPFEYHMYNLANHLNLTAQIPQNRFSEKISINPYSLGMGAIGLPGDLSSGSRFVKAAFTKLNSCNGDSESQSISQFFHILGSVCQQRGLTTVGKNEFEYTIYSSCCNTNTGIYYYTTYENSQICAVGMYNEDLDSEELISYPLIKEQRIHMQNG